jgi:FLVCR family feline leukemia virus subgroup C receptor-related protein
MILVSLGIITISATYFILTINSVPLLYLFTFLAGFFLSPIVPILLELSCELVYPLSGSFAVGTLYAGATLFSAFLAQLLTIIVHGNDSDKKDVAVGVGIISGSLLFGLIIFSFCKEEFNR